jgi:hypothetical protein
VAGEAHESDQILRSARQSLAGQRAGGRRSGSIGRRSAALKREHALRKLLRVGVATGAIVFAAMVAGLIVDGIGSFPRMKVPSRASLSGSDVRSLVGRTEIWLEHQRPALPAPAVGLVDQIGLQLDALGSQLDGLPENTPAAAEVRKLVGEHLPELVASYTAIPRHLRGEERGGRTPDQQLADSLGKISTEIDSVTRQLAAGAIDDLAIRTRYLDYKYGEGIAADEKPG